MSELTAEYTVTIRAWTDEEVRILRAHYADWSNERIARKLRRSRKAVQQKAQTLGLRRPTRVAFERAVKPTTARRVPLPAHVPAPLASAWRLVRSAEPLARRTTARTITEALDAQGVEQAELVADLICRGLVPHTYALIERTGSTS